MGGLRGFAAFLVWGTAVLAAGCGLLPANGPNAIAVKTDATWNGPRYGLVRLTPQVVDILDKYGAATLTATFGNNRPPPEIRFGIGDVLSVSIFEAAAGGLYIPAEAGVRPGNFVQIPNQPIDSRGNIFIPYAGLIQAAGKTATQVDQEIVDRIKNRAIDPQAVVALVNQNTSLVTVIGEINNIVANCVNIVSCSPSGRVALQPSGERVLDVIGRAGGLKDQGQDTWVVLERQGGRASVPFGSLIYDPGNNIWVWPNDTIYLYKEPQTFLAFGATGTQGQFPFSAGVASSAWRMTLAEGVAAAGGLLDLQADPGSVFLYRREPRELAEKLGVDCSKMDGPTVPIVYSVSFADPAGYFLGTKVQMRNKDVIFAANAQQVEITKFADFANTVISVPNNTVNLLSNIQTNRILFHTPNPTSTSTIITTSPTPATP
jgi:polysaccharide export outer membrane protein